MNEIQALQNTLSVASGEKNATEWIASAGKVGFDFVSRVVTKKINLFFN